MIILWIIVNIFSKERQLSASFRKKRSLSYLNWFTAGKYAQTGKAYCEHWIITFSQSFFFFPFCVYHLIKPKYCGVRKWWLYQPQLNQVLMSDKLSQVYNRVCCWFVGQCPYCHLNKVNKSGTHRLCAMETTLRTIALSGLNWFWLKKL